MLPRVPRQRNCCARSGKDHWPRARPSATTDVQVAEEAIGAVNAVHASASAPATPRQFLGDAPLHGPFFGRQHEMSRLRHWLLDEQCRLVAILGLGGMGKSALAARTMAEVAEQYDVVVWYSLLNAPELPELLATMLHMLPETPLPSLPDGTRRIAQSAFSSTCRNSEF